MTDYRTPWTIRVSDDDDDPWEFKVHATNAEINIVRKVLTRLNTNGSRVGRRVVVKR